MQNPDKQQNDKSQEEDQSNQGKQQDEGQQNNQGENGENKEQAFTAKGDKVQEDPWKDIDKVINRLHYQWNSYKPMAVKKMQTAT